MIRVLSCCFIFVIIFNPSLSDKNIKKVFEWQSIDFEYENPQQKEYLESSKGCNTSNIIPSDIDISEDGRTFISFLGRKGVPITLGMIPKRVKTTEPPIKPYPNSSWFEPNSCKSIQSVVKIRIDYCERLWVLDTDYSKSKKCGSRLLIFDIRKHQLINQTKVPIEIRNKAHRLTNLVVHTEGTGCESTTAYVSNSMTNKFASFKNFSSWDVFDNVLLNNSKTVESKNFTFGMDLSPNMFPGEPKFLFFRPVGLNDFRSVDATTLMNGTVKEMSFRDTSNFLKSNTSALAFSVEGTLFFGSTEDAGIACWNRYTRMASENMKIVAQDPEILRSIDSLKIVPRSYFISENQWLYILSNDIKNENDRKFRILKASVYLLIDNTNCMISKGTEYASVYTRIQQNGLKLTVLY